MDRIRHIVFICSSIRELLGGLHLLATANNTAMNTGVQVETMRVSAFGSFGSIRRSGIAGLYGNSMFNFCEETPYCLPQNFCDFKS